MANPKTGAAHLAAATGINPIKPFKQPGKMFHGNAPTLVPHPNQDFLSGLLGFNLYHGSGRAVFDGIINEVNHRLFE